MENIEFYAYLDIDKPMVAWEVAIGRIKSYCDRNPDNIGLSVWQYNMLRRLSEGGGSNRINHEFGLEAYRKANYSEKVSRLNGVYFFESEAMAFKALDRWGMSQKKKYVSRVNFSAEQLSKYDSEWITTYMEGECCDWYKGYLSGETLGAAPLTEVIASGIGIVNNRLLREQAYKKIMERWPTSTPLLSMAIAAFYEAGIEDVALVRPFLNLRDGALFGHHIIYVESLGAHQEEIGNAWVRLKQQGMLPPIIYPEGEDVFFTVPDLGEHEFKLPLSEAAFIYGTLHEF